MALADREHGGSCCGGHPGVASRARPIRHGRAADVDHRTAGIRRRGKGIWRGCQRSAAGFNEARQEAAPDRDTLNKINDQQKKLDQQKQQIEQQAQLQGATPDQAKAQANKQTSSQQDKLNSQRKKAENPATDSRLTDFSDAMKKAPDVKSVSLPTLDKGGHYAVYTVVPDSAPSSDATVNLVHTLRDTTIPNATKGHRRDGARRRPDRRLYRPGSSHQREAMPSWLDRLLPKISIEGEEYFAQRPAPAGTEAHPIPTAESRPVPAGAEAGR